MPPMRRIASAALIALLVASVAPARAANEVTIYRCTDAHGRLTLRDTPCAKGQVQQTRSMLRPKDAPAPPPQARARVPVVADDADADADANAAPAARVVVMHTPRPMYECTPPDGEPYTSDTPDGRPRWVPLWTLGYPLVPVAPRGHRPRSTPDTSLAITDGSVRIDHGQATVMPPQPVSRWAYGFGTWVRDECHPLPQPEVCARLRDRRDAIDHRFFNAMPNERDTLTVEERGINARLDEDCGGH